MFVGPRLLSLVHSRRVREKEREREREIYVAFAETIDSPRSRSYSFIAPRPSPRYIRRPSTRLFQTAHNQARELNPGCQHVIYFLLQYLPRLSNTFRNASDINLEEPTNLIPHHPCDVRPADIGPLSTSICCELCHCLSLSISLRSSDGQSAK